MAGWCSGGLQLLWDDVFVTSKSPDVRAESLQTCTTTGWGISWSTQGKAWGNSGQAWGCTVGGEWAGGRWMMGVRCAHEEGHDGGQRSQLPLRTKAINGTINARL